MGQELVVRALLGDFALLQDKDAVSVAHGAEPVSDDEAVARLSGPAMEKAAAFGARYVILGCGNRAVIIDGTVVTVLVKGKCIPSHYKDRSGR